MPARSNASRDASFERFGLQNGNGLLAGLICLIAALFWSAGAHAASIANAPKKGLRVDELPLVFEPNVGQATASSMYLSHAGAAELGFSQQSFSLRLPRAAKSSTLSIVLLGANQEARPVPMDKEQGESNYLLGSSPSQWKTHIPNYGRISYIGIYPGIDLVFYGNRGQLEHDFTVEPGTDYRQIRMQYKGARKLAVSADGDLHVQMETGEAILRAPRIYQNIDGGQQQVPGRFKLIGKDEVSFDLGRFNRALPLIIDPVLDWSTYLANLSIDVDAMTLDSAGNTYITGQAFASSYPSPQARIRALVLHAQRINPSSSSQN